MSYLLDTNICIYHLNNKSKTISNKLKILDPGYIFLCSIVKSELYYGALKSSKPDKNMSLIKEFIYPFKSVGFDDNASEIYAGIRFKLEKSGNIIGPNDLIIASIAIANNFTLVTHNTREFSRVPGLIFEDWHDLV